MQNLKHKGIYLFMHIIMQKTSVCDYRIIVINCYCCINVGVEINLELNITTLHTAK